jgi:PAS domain S-box-containing protein
MIHPKTEGKTWRFTGENKVRTILALICWTLVIIFLYTISSHSINYFAEQVAIIEARSQLRKDQAFRQWATGHGGVYVPVTTTTPPNPYLSHLPLRDITSPDGTRLTLMNPAYIIRQLNEQYAEMYGVTGHITSLKPLRPENKPDLWEQRALQAFEQGAQEELEFTEIKGEPYLRLMQPMITQQGCLKCHAQQGYKMGDIRGGVAISQPLATILAQKQKSAITQKMTLVGLWLLGALFIVTQGRQVNLSQLKQEKALRELQQERDMFMQGSVMTFTWKDDAKWSVAQVSANVEDVLGYTPMELLDGSKPYGAIIHPEDQERRMNAVRNATTAKQKSFTHAPYRLLTRAGDVIWVQDHTTIIYNAAGGISHYQGYLVDISETMQINTELQENKDRLELIINGANLGTWEWNIQTGEVVFNERWAEMIGCTLSEIKPHFSHWKDRLHPDDKEEIIRTLNNHLEGKSPIYMIEHRLQHKSGSWVWVLTVGRVFKWDDNGKPLMAVGIHMDINERKQAEQELAKAKKVAETANHAKSVFLSNMSHELRTPLNAILGYTQLFAGDLTLSPKHQQGLKTIHQSGEHLPMLINDILDLSKIEAGKIELVKTNVHLPQFLQGIVDIIGIRAQAKGLDFRYELDPLLPTIIEIDELRLRQVLLNLLANAVKFTDQGWCLFQVKAQPAGTDLVQLTMNIEDSGVGIKKEMQEEVFRPFQQTGERLKYAEGSGLGLAISSELIQKMQGKLQLTSPINVPPQDGEGPGCRFSFSIIVPTSATLDSTPQKTPAVTGYTSIGDDGKPKKVLIIDDHASNRAVLRDNLQPLGFITKELADGSKILAVCKQFQPDIILMDLKMPNVDGFKATEQLKSHPDLAHIPVVVITASSNKEHQSKAYCQAHGFTAVMTKPFSLVNLLEILAQQLNLQLHHAEGTLIPTPRDEKITLPPQAILNDLKAFAQSGDITSLSTAIADLAVLESCKYQRIAEQLRQLAEDFLLMEIEKLITHYEKD